MSGDDEVLLTELNKKYLIGIYDKKEKFVDLINDVFGSKNIMNFSGYNSNKNEKEDNVFPLSDFTNIINSNSDGSVVEFSRLKQHFFNSCRHVIIVLDQESLESVSLLVAGLDNLLRDIINTLYVVTIENIEPLIKAGAYDDMTALMKLKNNNRLIVTDSFSIKEFSELIM